MIRIFLSFLILVLTFCACTGSNRKKGKDTDGIVSIDGTVDGTSDDVVTDGSEGTDDTDNVDAKIFKCPEVDLPHQMRSRLTGKIGTLTRIEVSGKCGVHFVSRFAADYWGDDSPFSTEPDVFGGVLTLSRESDGTWKYVDSLAGEKYAEVYDPI